MQEENEETFVNATKNKNFSYWLRYEDIAAIRRYIPRLDHRSCIFEIVGSETQLYKHIRENSCETKPQVIVMETGRHWVLLVLTKINCTLTAIFVDSLGSKLIPDMYNRAIDRCGIAIKSLSIVQQRDGCNCGLYVLLNASNIMKEILSQRDVEKTTLLVPSHEEWFFQKWRTYLYNRLTKCDDAIARKKM